MAKLRYIFFSLIYKYIRRTVIVLSRLGLRGIGKTPHLELAESIGDAALSVVNGVAAPLVCTFKVPNGLKRDLFDLSFPSPLTFASFKSHVPTISMWLSMGVGGGSLKTIMPNERSGNQRPRLQECRYNGHYGLVNALGLPGPGIDSFLEGIETHPYWDFKRPIGISVGGNHLNDYVEIVQKAEQRLNALSLTSYYYELNISCPNTPDGQAITRNPSLLETLLRDVRGITTRTVGVKISPDQDDASIQAMAEIITGFENLYINAGNTQFKTCSDLGLRGAAISIGGGGLSGPSLFPRTCELVTLLSPFKVPIIATGGISSVEDARYILGKGALLIGLATALVRDPYCIPRFNYGLSGK